MPKVIGLPEEKARAEIDALNYDIQINVEYVELGPRPPGVISSQPTQGEPLHRGQSVTLTIRTTTP